MYTAKLLEKEVRSIINNSNRFVFPDIRYILHTDTEDIPINYPLYYDVVENYNSAISSEITVDFLMPMGDYLKHVYPKKDNLEISILVKFPDENVPRITRYKFMILSQEKEFENSRYDGLDKDKLNTMDVVLVKGQCIDPILAIYRQLYVSGVYKDTTVENVIKTLLSYSMNRVRIAGKNIDYSIDMRLPDNKRIYDHIIVKSFTKLAKLPHYLQDFDYGVYNGGINSFIKQLREGKYRSYIYQLYNHEIFDISHEPKLIFYNSKTIGIDLNDVTYLKENKIYKIVTNDIEIDNQVANKLTKYGSGLNITYPLPAISKDFTLVNEEEMVVDKHAMTEHVFSDKLANMIPNLINTNFDDNLYKFRSQILKNSTIDAKVLLRNIDERIFKPGMLLKYVYLKNDRVAEKRGNLQQLSLSYNIIKRENAGLLNFTLEK